METSENKQDKLSRQKEFCTSVQKPVCKSWEIILSKSKDDISINNFYLIWHNDFMQNIIYITTSSLIYSETTCTSEALIYSVPFLNVIINNIIVPVFLASGNRWLRICVHICCARGIQDV